MAFLDTDFVHRVPVTRFDGYRGFLNLTWASAALIVITGGLLLLDPRLLGDEPTWLKPFKFAISFAALFATLAIFTKTLSEANRYGVIVIGAVLACAAAFLFEMAYMMGQAARVELSHFNESSPFHEMMYGLMGVGATALMASIAAVGALVLLDKSASIGSATRLSIVLGALITAVLTSWIGGELAGNGGRFVGTPSVGGPTVPIVGWSMEVGDLRPAHFLSLHALQVVPLIGWYADRTARSDFIVWSSAALYSLLTVVIFFQALGGAPLISL